MIKYFADDNTTPETKLICKKLNVLKSRISAGDYSNSFQEFNEVEQYFDNIRISAIANEDEFLANAQVVFKFYFKLFCNLSRYFQMLMDKEYKNSWSKLQDCIDYVKMVGYYVDIENRLDIPDIYDLLESFELLYPYNLFASSEFVLTKSHCSICGKSMQSLECVHRKGSLYWGEVVRGIVDEIKEIHAICLVSNPEDKRCVMELSDDTRSEVEKFKKLDEFLGLKLPLLQPFSIESIIEKRRRSDIIKVGRNQPCSCGSGIKFKKCCDKKMYYEHERSIITPKKAITFHDFKLAK